MINLDSFHISYKQVDIKFTNSSSIFDHFTIDYWLDAIDLIIDIVIVVDYFESDLSTNIEVVHLQLIKMFDCHHTEVKVPDF